MSLAPSLETQNQSATADDSQNAPINSTFKCKQCAASLSYRAGTESLQCQYCQFENAIPKGEADIQEFDFHEFLQNNQEEQIQEERLVIKCDCCGAQSTSEPNVTSQNCPFCDTEIISSASSVKLLKPESLLPFKVDKNTAMENYKSWVSGLWFAPNKLKRSAALSEKLSGMYLPHWTYDCDTLSYFSAERGDHYTETVQKTRKNEEGETETYNEEVKKTRWRTVYGTSFDEFDDVMVVASDSLPKQYCEELEPWDLENLVPYQDDYLSGYKAESYKVNLEDGFEQAKKIMDKKINAAIKKQVGGDEQKITSVKTQHDNIKFKHILLPVWMSAYRYQDTVYRFMINARTGEVQGERPTSWVKVGFAIATTIAVIAGAAFLFLGQNGAV
ncbi:hypothetical protein [Marinicellulosiphila megalodicopiae]|uniref:hypothetical protein n=1 Tax=Marinicellulosiphila megalodicopiae TaxID=2724896 RepID=UPI003BAEFA3E